MRFKLPIFLSNQKADDNLVRFLSQAFDLITTILSGRVDFIENCDTSLVSVTFESANVAQAVNHGLNRTPTGYITVSSSVAGIVYSGTTANSAQYMYLQASVAGTYSVMVF